MMADKRSRKSDQNGIRMEAGDRAASPAARARGRSRAAGGGSGGSGRLLEGVEAVETVAPNEFDYRPGSLPVAEVKSRFRTFLAERQLRVTRERLAVVEEVFASRRHFDVEDLFRRLRSRRQAVSRATLYRTLELLVECGLVGRTRFRNDTFHYEPSYGRDHHDHMVCQQCGKVIEFVSADIEHLQRLACEAHDFELQSHRLVILGRCRECRGDHGLA